MPERPDVRSAVGNLVDDADIQALFAEDPEEPVIADPPEPDPTSGPDGAPHVDTPGTPAATAEDQAVTAEPADEYWGVDLRGIPPERQAEIIARFKQQDETIRKTQREAAEARRVEVAQQTPAATVEAPVVQTDDDFLAAQGFGEDHPYHSVAKELLLPALKPLVAQLQEARQQVQTLVEEREADVFAANWNDTLDALESEYGPLPLTRQELFDQALADGVFDPRDAYARAVLPVRKLNAEAAKARQDAVAAALERKARVGGNVPRGDAAKATEKLTASDIRSAVREAMPKVADALEFDWQAFADENPDPGE